MRIEHLVDKLITNVASVGRAEDGRGSRIFVKPYDDQNECFISYRNLCKAKEVQSLRKAHSGAATKDRPFVTAFCGDNRNDLCPAFLNATPETPVLVFPRRSHPLQPLLAERASDVRASAIIPWDSGLDILDSIRQWLK